MRIGILSMQRIVNYGSFLQAYALKRCFLERGCEVEFVDYHCKQAGGNADRQTIRQILMRNGRTLAGLIYARVNRVYAEKRRKAQLVNEFNSRFPQYAQEKLELIPDNYNPRVDALVIGSDEVFNLTQTNPEVGYSLELLGKDNNAQYLFSYAASFGNTTLQKLEENKIAEEVAYYLKRFTDISCRDTNSRNIVRQLTGHDAKKHIDPVLLYDFQWEMYHEKTGMKVDKPYLLVYAYANRITAQEADAIRQYAKDHGLLIVTCGMIQGFEDIYIPAMPFELLKYFQNASCVVTDTFHGAVLSVKFQKNFVTFVRSSKGQAYGNQEKLEDFIGIVNLGERIIRNIEELAYVLAQKIDYDTVEVILKEERQKAYAYLEEICNMQVGE